MRRPMILTAMTASVLAASSSGQDNTLSLFHWSEYMDPAIIKSFEAKFNAKVKLSLYESNEDMLAKLEAGGKNLYDVIVPTDYIVPVLVRKGLLQKLEPARLPNYKNLSTKFQATQFDPKNEYSAGYLWGTSGILYRKDKFQLAGVANSGQGKSLEPSWALVFDAKKQAGPFVMMDDPRVTIGSALKYLGKSLNSTNVAELRAAQQLLEDAKRRSKGLTVSIAGNSAVASGSASFAVVFNGDAIRAAGENKNLAFFVPREGSTISLDMMAIPAGAPNPKLAHAFINYLLDAKVSAQNANWAQFGSPNEAAKKFINQADLKNAAIYPSAAIMNKLEFVRDLGKGARLYDSVWTAFKAR